MGIQSVVGGEIMTDEENVGVSMDQDDPLVSSDVYEKGEASDSLNSDTIEGGVYHEGAEWYIIQCFSGQEYKVLAHIQRLIDDNGYQDRIHRLLIPEEETVEIKNNKRIEKLTKLYPGYVFIHMRYDIHIHQGIRDISGVSGFIGTKGVPSPVTQEDMLKILRKAGEKSKKIDVDFEEGEMVKVVSGPFRGYSGAISEINAEKGMLKAMISVFGRETPVQLDFDQVEKAVG